MIPLTHDQFQALLDSKIKFLVWFSAAWCGPCQRMEKNRLEEAYTPLYYCDVVENPDSVARAGIQKFPTFILYEEGAERARRVHSDTTKICQWINKTCK